MVPQSGLKNIRRVRTFAEDAAKVRGETVPKKAAAVSHEPADTDKPALKINPREPKQSQQAAPALTPAKTQPQHQSEPAKFVPKRKVDLSEEVSHISKPRKESILTDTDNVFEASSGSGNIIRDTKRKRFRLIPAMIEAASLWFKEQREAYSAFRHPHHAVAKAEARKTIIEEAVRSEAQAPKEDFKDVATRLKSIERKAVTSTLTFKEKSEVPAPTWTHVSEEAEIGGEPLSEAVSAQEEASAALVPEPADVPEPIVRQKLEAVMSETDEPDAPAVEEAFSPSIQMPVSDETEQEPPAVPMHEEDVQLKEPASYASNRADSKAATYALIAVIVAASLLGIGVSYYWFVVKDAPAEETVVYRIPSLIEASTQTPFRFGEDRQSTMTIISDFVNRSRELTQLYPTVVEEGIERPAPTGYIIQGLELRAPGSFTRSIQEVTFGATSGAEPFIILSVTSFDTAFAGMLEWEKTMSVDMSPLFGEPVISSFDPSARTDTQVREAFFKDAIASNKNVRLLLDEKGDDRIVYTFTDQNTILITTTRESLDEVLPLVR